MVKIGLIGGIGPVPCLDTVDIHVSALVDTITRR